MNIKTFNKLDVKVYEETLPSGLRIFVAPLERNSIYASFTTLFGSKDLNFIPEGKKEMYYMPPGIAHFLEHKMFERGEDKSVFEFFNESGTYNNAFTFKNKTEYIFEGPRDFENNLNFLIDFVLEPKFNTKNVEKEKPIILEEAKASFDSPIHMAYDVAMKNLFHENPYMYPIIGTYESIKAITKEELMLCHKTFYHPSNMILVVTGNIDPEKTIEFIKTRINNKNLSKPVNIQKEIISEPDSVARNYEETYMPITNEIFYLAYKINFKSINIKLIKLKQYLQAMFILKLGNLSEFNDIELRNGNLLGQLGIDILTTDDYLIMGIYGEVKDSINIIRKIQNELGELTITEKDLNLLKKSTLANLVLMNENPAGLNSKITEDISNYGQIVYNMYDIIESMNIEEYQNLIKALDLSNYTISIVKKSKKS